MKKKLMFSMLATLVFSLSIVTTLFIIIINYQYTDNIKQSLITSNKFISNMLENIDSNKIQSTLKNFDKSNLRITYIDKDGKVLYDSESNAESMENHSKRQEVVEAKSKGNGYVIRNSDTLKKDIMYYASKLSNGDIIRSSISIDNISVFKTKYFHYYIFIMILAIAMSVIFSSKLTHVIVKPIKDLEFITSRIARGELDRRAKGYADDEIGHLGITFNNMADKLQLTLNDSLDKQNKLEAILKSMDSGVIAVDKNYNVIMINPYAKSIFGIKNDIIGKKLSDEIRDYEVEKILKSNVEDYRELKILWPKERELRIKTADIINGYEKIGTVAVVQDITDIKRLENMRSQFVANVSHELKTPLTSIKGFAETLKYVDDPINKEKFLNIIDAEAERLTRLINDILSLSDIETSMNLKNDNIDINEIINNVHYLIKNNADKKNISMSIVGEKLPVIKGDEDRFKQMIINLVDNAIKYSDDNGSIEIGTKFVKSNCVIWVKDSGVGIPKEDIHRVFERFYRVDKARSRAQGGTGLGLAIVKHIVMSFRGTIELESELGKGSNFIISIPAERG